MHTVEKQRSTTFCTTACLSRFSPQLIAGPIVHHKEMLPQFAEKSLYKIKADNLAVGVTIFSIGLFKKVILADGIAVYATPMFDAAEWYDSLTFFEAWCGALAYSLQLYFDFSGYSDMAIGIARMFGVKLPINFYSPYKAHNIIEFWRRWHITLSRFLRDYLYFPIGGNRRGVSRRYVNVMITMLLGGLWHGAGWTFVVWGGLHGGYIIINDGWLAIRKRFLGDKAGDNTLVGRATGRIMTFTVVVIAWVVFRAESLDGAMNMYAAMFGLNGISLPWELVGTLGALESWLLGLGVTFDGAFYNTFVEETTSGGVFIASLLLLVWFFPNTLECMTNQRPALGLDRFGIEPTTVRLTRWRPRTGWAIGVATLALFSILSLTNVSEFLYFQF